MDNRLRRFPSARVFALGAATLTLLWLPGRARAQSTSTQDRQATSPQDTQSSATQDRQPVPGDDITRRDLAHFDQFLDSHREIAEQLRRTPSLIDDPQFLRSHPELDTYLQDHPSVKQEISAQPDTFMRLEDLYSRDRGLRDRDAAGGEDRDAAINRDMRDMGGQDRDADRRDTTNRDAANFDRFLDQHREIAEQVRKDPSLLDDRKFVDSHPALQAYLQDNAGVRDQLRQDPNAFMRQADLDNRDLDQHDRDTAHDRMADFGGFLGSHSDIRKDLSRNPAVVKDHEYVQSHAELDAYLTSHPDVRSELMADPQNFVHGSQQYSRGGAGTAGAGVTSGRGAGVSGTTGATGTSTGTSINPTKPNQ